MLYSRNGFVANLKPSSEEIITQLEQRVDEKRRFYSQWNRAQEPEDIDLNCSGPTQGK